MNKLNFDNKGHLVPYDLIETDWKLFVGTFGWNEKRRALISQLYSFVTQINNLSIKTFTLWIDGSFVTRKEEPNDLDVVVVLPTQVHSQFENDLRMLRDQFDGLDLYMVRLISQDEPNHFLYMSDRVDWIFQFTMTKAERLPGKNSRKVLFK